MSSYFVNSSFPVTLPGPGGGGGQAAAESFLGQIPLYSSGYAADHPLRHYPAAAAVAYSAGGSGVHQDKAHTASYYQQAGTGAYGGHRAPGVGVGATSGAGACDYATAAAAAAAAAAATSFYRDKDHQFSLEEHQLALGQDGMHRKAECAGLGGKGLFGEPMDDKQSSVPIYPWMQRMNACNGEWLLLLPPPLLLLLLSCIFYDARHKSRVCFPCQALRCLSLRLPSSSSSASSCFMIPVCWPVSQPRVLLLSAINRVCLGWSSSYCM